MNKKPLIFITNDDGHLAGGINALIESVKGLGEIIVVAPDGPRSGFSSAITSINPIRVFQYSEAEDLKIYVCTGTPVDCVKLGIGEVLGGRLPDLILTGINHGSNSAVSVLYSGTMGAAMEGCLFKIPSIGFSLLDHAHDANFGACNKYTRLFSQKVLAEGLPTGTCLNVNIPQENGSPIKGVKVVRQTKGRWVGEYKKDTDGGNHPVYWLTGQFENDESQNTDTDEYVLEKNYISVVPVKVDMTDYDYLAKMKEWENIK